MEKKPEDERCECIFYISMKVVRFIPLHRICLMFCAFFRSNTRFFTISFWIFVATANR